MATALNDQELLSLLATCAEDVYTPEKSANYRKEWLDFKGITITDAKFADSRIQYGVYRVKLGKHKDKSIVAFMGTNLESDLKVDQLWQDVSIAVNGRTITAAIKSAIHAAPYRVANYVTGHSLGGLLAEAVCSHKGLKGASFGAPGPVGTYKITTIAGDAHKGVPFECVINTNDPIPYLGGRLSGVAASHINDKVKQVTFGPPNTFDAHKMHKYTEAVGILPLSGANFL